MAAFSRIANGTHRQIRLFQVIQLSYHPHQFLAIQQVLIEQLINYIVREQMSFTSQLNDIHTSGHGGQEEQKL